MSRALLLGILAVAACTCGHALAQFAAPPGASPLPSSPVNPRLPGVDQRQCGSSKWSALCAVGRWTLFSTLDVQVKTSGFTGDYRLEQTAGGELHATYREDLRGKRRGGEAVLFGTEGIAFRTRDELPPADAVIDYLLSTPIMMGRLVAVLLDLGVIGPPSDVTRPLAIKAGSATQFLRSEAPRMATLYGPPWSMTGNVKPAGDGRLAFALELRYRPVDNHGVPIAGRTDTLELAGTVNFAERRATLPDTFDLVGWKLMKGDVMLGGAPTLEEARAAVGP
jgi:hypothetical protein